MPIGEESDVELEVPSGTLGLHTLHQPPQGSAIFADVVAVHGLGGDGYSTWTHKKSGQLWLRDFLPESPYFANTRILTFGYSAKTWITPLKTTSRGRTFTFAEELLARLRSLRILRGGKGRPLFFIGHSLGGIVIKKALIIANSRQELYGDIYDCCKAIVFLGTPHQGSDTAAWATYLGRITKAFGINDAAITKELCTWSDTLLDLSREFCEQMERYKITSFFEAQPYRGVYVVQEGSAYLGYRSEVVMRAEANHRTICKFDSKNSSEYLTVLDQLEVRMHEIGNVLIPASY